MFVFSFYLDYKVMLLSLLLWSLNPVYMCIILSLSCERTITRAMCARDLRGGSAPVTSPAFLFNSCSASVTWWRLGILQKIPLLSCVANQDSEIISSWSYFPLTCFAALVILFERSLYDSYGCGPAHELPVLRSHLCHRQRRWNHNRPHCSSGEGRQNHGRQSCY